MRKLTPLKANGLPSRVAFLDCETRPVSHSSDGKVEHHGLRLGVISFARIRRNKLSGKSDHVFRTPAELHSIMDEKLSPKFTVWLFAHSVAYDLQASGILSWIKEGGLRICSRWRDDKPELLDDYFAETSPGLFVVNDPPTIMHLQTADGRRIFIVDSLNYFQCSLKKLGKQCGLPKFDMPAWEAPDEKWIEYCQRDVDILAKTMWELMRFVNNFGLGTFAFTAAGQAMRAFRTKYIKHDIEVHKNVNVRKLERKGYYGGEVRLFRLGEYNERVYQLDVNSLYPFTMFRAEFPTKLLSHRCCSEWIKPPDDVDWSKAIATVWLDQDEREYPLREDNRLWWLRGSFPTTLAGPELQWAIESEHVHAVMEWATYQTAPIFDEYVWSLYLLRDEYREEGNDLYADFCKMLLNSLYGKFGQKGTDMLERPSYYEHERWGTRVLLYGDERKRRIFRFMNGRAFEELERKDLKGSIPAIAAFVTSHAREYMQFIRAVIGQRNVFYQGVDSVLVNAEGVSRLENAGKVSQRRLGCLKQETEADTFCILGQNHYKIGGKDVLSGRSDTAFEVTSTGYKQTITHHLKTVLFELPTETIERITRRITLPREQHFGTVDDNGWITPPSFRVPPPELR